MSGGGSDNRIKETPEQKELARVSAEKWNFSQQKLAPLMDQYMQKTDQMKSDAALAYQRGRSNEASQTQFNTQRQQVNQSLNNMGLDPSSGRAMQTRAQLGLAGGAAAGDHSGRVQNEQLNQHVKGLQNITAIGMGEAGQAQAGIGQLASLSAANQRSDAFNTFNRKSANLQLLGNLAGAGTSMYSNQSSPAAGLDIGSVADSGTSLNQNRVFNPQANTYLGGR